MAFNFSFSDDGMEVHDANSETLEQRASRDELVADSSIPPRIHTIEELIANLPSKIAWNVIKIQSPQGRTLLLPRRELFDVRMQLMAEDDSLYSSAKITGLDDADIRTNIYEGGFKSWECSYDLANFLLDRSVHHPDLDASSPIDHVLELGCGTAIPSSVLFRNALEAASPLHFTFTDYNSDVLELVTFPNIFLTYASTLGTASGLSDSTINLSDGTTGDLDITDDVKASFLQALKTNHISLTFISGSWSPVEPWLTLVPISPETNALILASETIYSPSALESFTTAMVEIMRKVHLGKALIAAKRVYFGVGGSVSAFKIEAARQSAVVAEIENHGVDIGDGEGVRRCLLEAQLL